MSSADARYDVFISYSHSQQSGPLAVELQSKLQRLGKPWYGRRGSLRVFRDKTDLAASPDLWGDIQRALESSKWLIVMVSPEAAGSRGVAREIEWWLAHRSSDRILIALVQGELAWDENTNTWSTADTLPQPLRNAFRQEPLWVDLRWSGQPGQRFKRSDPRMQDCAADLASTITDTPKATIVGEDIRQYRRTIRTAITAVVALVVLLLASIVTGVVAVDQRNTARKQAEIAQSRLLAARADNLTETRLDLAQLFAAQAYEMNPDDATRAALLGAVSLSPHLRGFYQADGRVSAVAGSGDGRVAVGGTEQGHIWRWDLTTGQRALVAKAAGKVTSLGVDATGDTVVALGGDQVAIWSRSGGTKAMVVPSYVPHTVGISPSGRFVIVSADTDAENSSAVIGLLDRKTGHLEVTPTGMNSFERIAVPDDSQFVGLDGAYGTWARISLPDLRVVRRSPDGFFGAHNWAVALSPDGEYFSYSNTAAELPIWDTQKAPTTVDSNKLAARVEGTHPEALALSEGGARLAIADTGVVYVSDTVPKGATAKPPQYRLAGNEAINDGALAFVGQGDDVLLAASEDRVALWDLRQYSRIGTSTELKMPSACNGCGGPSIAPRPGRQTVAAVSGNGDLVEVADMGAKQPSVKVIAQTDIFSGEGDLYGSPAWSHDGDRLFLPTPSNGGGETRSAAGSMPIITEWQPIVSSEDVPSDAADEYDVVATGVSPDDRWIIELTSSGRAVIRNADKGTVARTLNGASSGQSNDHAAMDAATKTAVFGGDEGVTTLDLKSGKARKLAGGGADDVAYSGENLLILRTGVLQVLDRDGSRLLRSIPINGTSVDAHPSGRVVVKRPNGSAALIDTGSGNTIGNFPVPGGPRAPIAGAALSADGRHLILIGEAEHEGSDMGTLVDFRLSDRDWLRTACDAAGHQITATEWRQYIGTQMPHELACSGGDLTPHTSKPSAPGTTASLGIQPPPPMKTTAPGTTAPPDTQTPIPSETSPTTVITPPDARAFLEAFLSDWYNRNRAGMLSRAIPEVVDQALRFESMPQGTYDLVWGNNCQPDEQGAGQCEALIPPTTPGAHAMIYVLHYQTTSTGLRIDRIAPGGDAG